MATLSPSTQTDKQRPFVLLPSRAVIDLANPDPVSWTDQDLAIGLSRTLRWGGHSAWPRPLSVAQHSLSVLAIRLADDPTIGPGEVLYKLLHDAEEGLLGFDCIAPLNPFLGKPFAALCQLLTAAIFMRYQFPVLSPAQHAVHKAADTLAAASEALHVVRWSPDDIRSVLKITLPPLLVDPLDTGDYAPWEPWPSEYAADCRLACLNRYRPAPVNEKVPVRRVR
jgi:uncharacterized protein